MNLLYVADNGFSYHEGKYYCTPPNKVNIEQYKKYFNNVVVIARLSKYQDNAFEIDPNIKVFLIRKNHFEELWRYMKSYENLYDAVLMRNGINGCVAGIFARIMDKKTIAYCGADPYEYQRLEKNFFRRKVLAYLWKDLEQWKMINADYAQYCTEYLYRKYPTSKPYLICSNADVSIDENDYWDRLRNIKKNKNKYVIGMIGKVNENKGIRTIIQTCANLDESYTFEVIGDGEIDSFIEDINTMGVSKRMKFLGYYTDKEKIKEWLKGIDVYIQPSLSEGMPRATIEAMSMACPCIATNIAGLPDLLKKEYLIDPNDHIALAKKIKWLIEDKIALTRAAKYCFEEAKKFDKKLRDRKLDYFFYEIINDFMKEV